MATNTIGRSLSAVTLPNQFPPMPAVARILSKFGRDQLHGFIEVALDLADAMDGDPDIEDATDAEDEGLTVDALAYANGPGCIVTDPDYAVDDQPCDNDDDREQEDGY